MDKIAMNAKTPPEIIGINEIEILLKEEFDMLLLENKDIYKKFKVNTFWLPLFSVEQKKLYQWVAVIAKKDNQVAFFDTIEDEFGSGDLYQGDKIINFGFYVSAVSFLKALDREKWSPDLGPAEPIIK